MKAKEKHLLLRNSNFYFRQKVPQDLRHLFNKEHLQKSLKTSDVKTAEQLAAEWSVKANNAFNLLRSPLTTPEQVQAIIESLNPPKKEQSVKPKLLSQLVKLYVEEKSPGWTRKTRGEYEAQFDNIILSIGDGEIDRFDRSDCLRCRKGLAKLGLEQRTVNKYMGQLSTLFRWAIRHEYARYNPAEGLIVAVKTRPDEDRVPYSIEDLQRIIDNLPFVKEELWRVWVPLIGMYSGLRREEICQLAPEDIVKIDGIWCFDVNDRGKKKLKTESAFRYVPVHSNLVNLGLLEFVKKNKERENLWGFVSWKYDYGKKFGNWYALYFNRKYITKDPKKCFHSFRHLVGTTLKHLDVNEVLIAEILGHKNNSITTGRYGKRFLPPKAQWAIELLQYPVNLGRMEDLKR